MQGLYHCNERGTLKNSDVWIRNCYAISCSQRSFNHKNTYSVFMSLSPSVVRGPSLNWALLKWPMKCYKSG